MIFDSESGSLKIYEGQIISDKQYIACVEDILNSDTFWTMQDYTQHGNTSCLNHCVHVSYCSYLVARYLNLDYKSVARAGLLHDLFLYDWHTHARETNNHFHGLTHPRTALENAMKDFSLNVCEKDIILRHMWPLTLIPPKYKEGYIVMLLDKYCGTMEVFHKTSKMIPAIEKMMKQGEVV